MITMQIGVVIADCLVKSNCSHRYDCSFCENYKNYTPVDRRILSPAQLDKRDKRKKGKKDRDPERVKLGRKNKRTGYQSERYLREKYESWGIPVKRQPGSGKFKGTHASDFQVTILGKIRLQEDKTRSSVSAYFKRTRETNIMYGDYCVLLNEESWRGLVVDGVVPKYICKPDNRIQTIKNFFDQDNAEIVSIRQPGSKECVFAIKMSLWEELTNEKV